MLDANAVSLLLGAMSAGAFIIGMTKFMY